MIEVDLPPKVEAFVVRTPTGTLVADVTIRVDQRLPTADGSYTIDGQPVDYEVTV